VGAMVGKFSFIKILAPLVPHFGVGNSPTRAIVDFGVRLQDGYARRK
jgi:hypothetical protein